MALIQLIGSLALAESQLSIPVLSINSNIQKIPLSQGRSVDYFHEVTSGVVPQESHSPIMHALKRRLAPKEDGSESFPIEKVIVVPQGTSPEKISQLQQNMQSVLPKAKVPQEIKMVQMPNEGFEEWFERDNTVIFSIIRFFFNGAVIGATLIYSTDSSLLKSVLVGLLSATVSGSLEYKVKAFRDWLRAGTLVSDIGLPVYDIDDDLTRWGKTIYNHTLDIVEKFGKFGLSELGYISLARLAMTVLKIGNLPLGLYENIKSVLINAGQSTLAQGTADLGLLSDLTMQDKYNGWSDELRDTAENIATLFISAASVAVTAFQMANPGVSGEISLGIIDLPYGFAAITVVGLGFYLHGLITEWNSDYAYD